MGEIVKNNQLSGDRGDKNAAAELREAECCSANNRLS